MIKKLVFGVGINDSNTPVTRVNYIEGVRTVTSCPYYKKWYGIINRCYDKSYQERKPSYVGATVCKEWLTFSNFKRWCIEQEKEVGDISKLELDKDLLSTDSNHYSPSTCCFLPKKVNMFLQIRTDGKQKSGVIKRSNISYRASYRDSLRGKRINIGSYPTEELAYQAYLSKKVDLAKEIASTSLVPQQHVKEALINYYQQERING
ncbi:TPA: hypothetical protein RSW61_001940 [Vibrio harveyi]|nr:hypothetical protein [Vibrio harveyi]